MPSDDPTEASRRDVPPSGRVADAVAGHWADRLAPRGWRPYLRLARIERPVGWWLLLLPCWWSAALAATAADRTGPNLWHLLLFLIGAVAMRGAGSTYNDIADRDLDARVARTRSRPLPSGQIGTRTAAVFLVAQMLVGLCVLLQFNGTAILVGMAALLPVAIYPFMKRVMPMPQAVLGLAFAWGALMGWVALFGRLDAPALWLYAGTIAWVVGYDTIYAVQDIEDDEIAGISSSARLFGSRLILAVGVCYGAAVLLMVPALRLAGAGALGWLGLALFGAHLARQALRLEPRDGLGALTLFRSNRDAGLIFFLGLAADSVWQGLIGA
ncbi:4-hydroxybenzoate octaprenyltransferase [Methylobacterium haplocladii]|uniref:4-hydroxybenzoate octaprenyltransferase n=1 Tax=Methylobacterium haplocladii TaxID=1176176 RepID=A0A512IT36_9HYPH|nr:4-hydroxybenzoate octaprenyltransferase [Methylobacterium haplocladii]GEP00882.1 4-hydroxybenzoate octaprenyltransferase [Methylobacterium haplocladii]GJD82208.1 4-hydroxybenzoate octaprenyltransferase [Methylobacterium haplocladii]GLS60795.1 4-hydroxybenzoate octaprenyltransferase [Methylobacterium haplocladii]